MFVRFGFIGALLLALTLLVTPSYSYAQSCAKGQPSAEQLKELKELIEKWAKKDRNARNAKTHAELAKAIVDKYDKEHVEDDKRIPKNRKAELVETTAFASDIGYWCKKTVAKKIHAYGDKNGDNKLSEKEIADALKGAGVKPPKAPKASTSKDAANTLESIEFDGEY